MGKKLFIALCFLGIITNSAFAENRIHNIDLQENKTYPWNQHFNYNTNWQYNVSLLALSDADTSSGTRAIKTKSSKINLHRLLGWSTIIAAAATLISGAAGSKDVHCGLAGLSTALAAVTCADGFYEYHDLIGLDSDTRYTAHAAAGMLATAGFAASLFFADGKSHTVTGGISGAAFLFTIGIVYF
jgi:hypothetical protein